MLVDSHCHLDRLDLAPWDGQLKPVLDEAREQGVEHFLCVSVTLEEYPAMLALVEGINDISVSVGVHPNHYDEQPPTIEELLELAQHQQVVAIGETGLDYFRGGAEHKEIQQAFLCTHIAAAKQSQKPLIIHTREAREDTIAVLREESADQAGGVLHCFTEDWAMAKKGLDLGFYISLSGIVTFNSAKELQETAKKIPADRLLIETDSPWLAPVPKRGKANYPAYVAHTAAFIAQLRGVSVEELGEQTTENFYQLFFKSA
ncbi:MAG: TatD family hydrolase [Gammaproteobacteria bacterium]|nr:TatD family hydrolase [Gammaproteobacteria bacterium]